MKVDNPEMITRFSRAAVEAFLRGAAPAGGHCYLMMSMFEEPGGLREAAALVVPVCGHHNLFLAGPLAPDAGEWFGGDAREGYRIPVPFIDAALRKNPEGRSVEVYLNSRNVGIGFGGDPREWIETGAPVTFPTERKPGMPEGYDDFYLEGHIVTEYAPAAVRLFLVVVDEMEHRHDILIRSRPVWFPAQDSLPSFATGIPAGLRGEIGLTGPYRGRVPEPWVCSSIEVLRVPRTIVDILARSSNETPEHGRAAGKEARMVLGSLEGAYCKVESGRIRLQRCLAGLPRFPRPLRLPGRNGGGSKRIHRGRDSSVTDGR